MLVYVYMSVYLKDCLCYVIGCVFISVMCIGKCVHVCV